MPPKGVIPPQLRPFAFTSETALRMRTVTGGYDPFTRWGNLIANAKSAGFFSVAAIPGKPKGEGGTKLGGHLVVHIDPKDYTRMMHTVGAMENLGRTPEIHEALQKVGEYIVEEVVPDMFEAQANYQGMWPILEESTKKWRISAEERLGGNAFGPILQFTGKLFDAATDPHQMIEGVVGGDNARVVIGGKKIWEWQETNKFYTHMLGGKTPKGNKPIPARPFIPQDPKDFSPTDNEKISNIFQHYIELAIERKKRV